MGDFLRRMFGRLIRVFPMPDINDSVAVRKYTQRILGFLDGAADWCPGQWDDEIVHLAQSLVGDDETWAAIHAFIVARLANEPGPELAPEAGELAAALTGVIAENTA